MKMDACFVDGFTFGFALLFLVSIQYILSNLTSIEN
jgi:hypothetical protein